MPKESEIKLNYFTGDQESKENTGDKPVAFDVFFTKTTGKKGEVLYKSSAPDRKLIILDSKSLKPKEGKPYMVEIIEDTLPEDPMKGKLIARIIMEPSADNDEFDAPIEEEEETILDVRDDKVKILGLELKRKKEIGPHVPEKDKFNDFAVDSFSLEMLEAIAKAEKMDTPLLIEGEAAAGKSFTIEYLAHLCNREVYRMSLNGQTDTSDLIGKWVPKTGGLRKTVNRLLDDPEKCKSELTKKLIESKKIKPSSPLIISQKINEKIKNIYSGFTKEDMQEICRLENIQIDDSDWAWQNGDIPKQMEKGAWSVLDEVNTCEPQILVRLNSVLEKNGQLVLSEDGSKKITRHPDFRIFATVNPPGGKYKGRIPLSAEWISRWAYLNVSELPKEIRALRLMKAEGVSSDFLKDKGLENFDYTRAKPIEEGKTLADYYGEEWIIDLFTKYAEFAEKAKELVKNGQIAGDNVQEQKFDFDQRDDVRFRDYLRAFRETGKMEKTIKEAVKFCFINKCKDKTDRKKIEDLMALIKIKEPKEIAE